MRIIIIQESLKYGKRLKKLLLVRNLLHVERTLLSAKRRQHERSVASARREAQISKFHAKKSSLKALLCWSNVYKVCIMANKVKKHAQPPPYKGVEERRLV